MSSHARARALCFAAASAFLSDPHSALHSLLALTDAHADDSLMHGALNSFVLCRKGPTGRRCSKGRVSGPAEGLRPVSEVGAGVNFRPAGWVRGAGCRFTSQEATRHRYQAGQGKVRSHLTPTRRLLIPNSCHLGADWTSGNRWARRRCVEPHGREFGC